jgi:hypothetical protein
VLERTRRDLILWTGVIAAAFTWGCGGAATDAGSAPGSSRGAAAHGDDPTGDAGVAMAEADAEPPPAAVTFVLENTHPDRDLVFSLDRGWQPVIFAFSGEPPNATPIIMFPKHCTAACEVDEADRCPVCPEPTEVRDIKAAQKREVVAPGETFEVEWDAEVFVYSDTRGTRNGRQARCECHAQEPVPEDTYTVRACGFRVSTEPNRPSTYQCVDSEMTFPADGPMVVELEFPEPPAQRRRAGR